MYSTMMTWLDCCVTPLGSSSTSRWSSSSSAFLLRLTASSSFSLTCRAPDEVQVYIVAPLASLVGGRN